MWCLYPQSSESSLSVQDSGDEAIFDFEQARGPGPRGSMGRCWHPQRTWYPCDILSLKSGRYLHILPVYIYDHSCVLNWLEKWFPTTTSWSKQVAPSGRLQWSKPGWECILSRFAKPCHGSEPQRFWDGFWMFLVTQEANMASQLANPL